MGRDHRISHSIDGSPSNPNNKIKGYNILSRDNSSNDIIADNKSSMASTKDTTKTTTDEPMQISDLIGHWGKYQFYIYLFKILIGVTSSYNNLGVTFYAPTQFINYRCKQESTNGSATGSDVSYHSGYSEQTGSIYNIFSTFFYSPERNYRHGEHYDINYDRPSMLTKECYITGSNQTNVGDSCRSFEYNTGPWISTIIEEWDLVCRRGWLISLSQSLYMSGFIVSFLLFGYLSDRFGRYKSLLCGALIETIAGFCCATAGSIEMFLLFRFLLGIGNAGRSSTSYLIMIEWVGKKYRMHVSTLGSFGWVIGHCTMPWVTQYFLHFRHVQLFICFYEFLLIIWLLFLPESPRWLLTHKRYGEARQVLYKAAKFNGANAKDLEQFDAKFKQLELEMSTKKYCENEHKLNIFDLFKAKNLRKYSLILYMTWGINAFIYYGIALRVGDFGGKNLFVDFTLGGITELPSAAITILCMKFMPRRVTNIFIFGIIGIICGLLTPAHIYEVSWAQRLLVIGAKFFMSCSFTNILYQTIEIYPTTLRQTATSSCMIAGRIGSILAPFIKELAQLTSTSYPPLIYAALAVLAGSLIIRLPETKGTEMPDTMEEAENFTGLIKKQETEPETKTDS